VVGRQPYALAAFTPGEIPGIARVERDGTRTEPDFVFPQNGRVHLYRWGRQFSRLLAAEVCASA